MTNEGISHPAGDAHEKPLTAPAGAVLSNPGTSGRPSSPITLFLEANPEIQFAWETLKRVALFTIIAMSAVGLHLIVEELEHRKMPPGVTITLTVVAYLILAADVIWFLRSLLKEMAVMLADLLSEFWLRIIAIILFLGLGAILSGPLKSATVYVLRTIGLAANYFS
jgi:hypothetical protein